ncbi:hypothetical protein JXA80_08625 [bacterium]|nr:hypothetical protein [candidate division CSSED10-310 bacterium]
MNSSHPVPSPPLPNRVSHTSRMAAITIAAVCLIAAWVAQTTSGDRELVKIKPFNFAEEHRVLADITLREVDRVRNWAADHGISFEAARSEYLALHRSPHQLALGALSLNDYIIQRTSTRPAPPVDPEAIALLLTEAWTDGQAFRRSNVHGIVSAYYFIDEPVIRDMADRMHTGEIYWLYGPDDQWFETIRIPPDTWRGPETGAHDEPLDWQAPDAFRYPWRRYTRGFLIGAIAALVGPWLWHRGLFLMRRGVSNAPQWRNPEKRVAIGWLVAVVAVAVGCFVPRWSPEELMQWGYAVRALAAFFMFVGLLVVWVYSRRAEQLDRLKQGIDCLAHWTYTEASWLAFIRRESRRDASRVMSLYAIMVFFFILIGVIVLIVARAGGPVTFFLMMAIMLAIGIAGAVIVRRRTRVAHAAEREVMLSASCVYAAGQFHSWTMLGARLESVQKAADGSGDLAVVYSYPTRFGRSAWVVHFPVPDDPNAVQSVIDRLRAMIR